MSFPEHYAALSDDELLHIAADRKDLLEEAALALDVEMARRGFTHERARAHKRAEFRAEIREARAHHRMRKKSKYFEAQANMRVLFIGLIGFVIFLFLIPHNQVSNIWLWPSVVVYFGAFIAISAVQPWVKGTVSFWVCLAISSVTEFLLSYWLEVHYPSSSNSGAKGTMFLGLLVGYSAGGALFALIQRLKPAHDALPDSESSGHQN